MSDIYSSAPLARGERYGFNHIATTILVSIIAILINVPFVTAILTSFKTTAAISDPLSLPIGGNATLGHY
jgi:ABC-type glycerol-3-phosphate transport system permease component